MGQNLKYMEWAGVTMGELEQMTEGQLRRRIGDRVEVEWRLEMESKSTLETYRKYKLQMEELDYDKGMESVIWFRARTNCLELNGRKRAGTEGRSHLWGSSGGLGTLPAAVQAP